MQPGPLVPVPDREELYKMKCVVVVVCLVVFVAGIRGAAVGDLGLENAVEQLARYLSAEKNSRLSVSGKNPVI